MRIVRLGLAAAVFLAGATLARQPDPLEARWETDRQTWSGVLETEGRAGATTIRVVNEYGDIRTRGSEDSSLDVLAVIQRRQDVEEEFELRVVEDDRGLLVEVLFPETAINRDLLLPGRPADRRVDVSVFVPPGVELEARTVNGLIEAKGLTADAHLRSELGDLVAVTTGSLDARTEHGSVLAQFRDSSWTKPPRIETVTGDIRVELPHDTNAFGSLETRFEITTDYSIEIDRNGILKSGRATIGRGGPEIVLNSHKGAIKLLEAVE